MTKADALGRWLQLNPEVKKRHLVSTWRLAGAGDVLGWTLAVDGNAIVVGQVNAKSSGANFAPIPAEHPRLSLGEVASWTLSEAMRKIDEEQVTDRDLNGLYRSSGGNPRITWTAYVDEDEVSDSAEIVPGVFVASAHVRGLVPLETVLTGRKSIILTSDDIAPVAGEDAGRLVRSPFTEDGSPSMSPTEKLRHTVSRWDRS
ncbi:hypothetical protein [Corynebacterium glyciniphilum]|uniref:hypothetical protein n=1 Tax=Corynebacterium glyciniphilum TaxID=1404244 RepID=UPI0011AB8ADB|nr:hypothetical protein [Corynebacterium glyciniphilum]